MASESEAALPLAVTRGEESTATSSSSSITLRAPSKFSASTSLVLNPPPLEWLERTWTVTHSTLPMWRKAKNVRITYKILPPAKEGDVPRLDDLVESVPTEKTWLPQPKQVRGVDTAVVSAEGEVVGWNWRGKGLLKIASSHWEVLGWGEWGEGEGKERWAVTWFESTMFTPQGLDVYSDRNGGVSEGLFEAVEKALEGVKEAGVGELCGKEMRKVVIDDA